MVLHLNKLESPSSMDALCQVWLKLDQWFWRKELFYLINVFLLFRNFLLLEKVWGLHLNLNPLHPRMHCAKFGRNWLSGSGEEDFFAAWHSLIVFARFLLIKKLCRIDADLTRLTIFCTKQRLLSMPGCFEQSLALLKTFLNVENLPLEKWVIWWGVGGGGHKQW